MPADGIGLGFGVPDSGLIRVVSSVAAPDVAPLWGVPHGEFPVTPALAAVMRTHDRLRPETNIVNRPADLSHALWLEAFPHLVAHSAIFVDLGVDGHDVGGLVLWARGLDRYTEADGRLLESIRQPLSVAMSNARRFEELRALKEQLAAQNRALADDMKRSLGVEVVGAAFGLRGVMDLVRRVAPSTSPVLLLGETGTGKEVLAHAIHMASRRSSGPMIALQCGAVPESLLDSELFGHERGAFTGASERKRGRFERARGGTLFLDEIGALSLDAQVKLLRVLQERRFERIGGTQTVDADVRVVAATHRDLEGMVRDGRFREDLWYRLNVLPIHIPPLRMRRGDIRSLVHHLVQRKARELGLAPAPDVTRRHAEFSVPRASADG